jgi:DNA-binding Lrp family transcriptional regulator
METSQNEIHGEENPSDLNRDIALMVKEIIKVGPRVPEIARRLGRHKETVRYWYKKLEEHHFGVQAEISQDAMGLRRIIFNVRFGEAYKEYITPLMSVMADLCYLSGYSKSMPGDTYILNASVPIEHTQEYLDLFEELRQQGVFTEVDYTIHDWFANVPMRTDFYDFEHGRWVFDGEPAPIGESHPAPEGASPHPKLDKIDLLIAKELYIDATRELREIQQSIKEYDGVDINYKTLCWHLSEHVERNGLLKRYKINWMGTHYDTKSKRNLRPQHTYTGAELSVKAPTREELSELMEKMRQLPMLWSEAGGRDYYAYIAIPNELVIETLQFIQKAILPVRDKSTFHLIDMSNSLVFTIPYKLYQEESRSWEFNKVELLAKFSEFIVQVKNLN